MREIKIRGYSVVSMVNSQWLYGFGVDSIEYAEDYAKEIGRKRDWYLYTDSGSMQVHEKSIGQYTGLKDKNGKEIYEGDLLKTEDGVITKIVYDEASFKCVFKYNGSLKNCILDNLFISSMLNPEVIGNIYDNPELLKG